ncbi:LysM peptidoglycan-binding domain-containing protein [Pseudarthrobacter sulfonivorans]|uniref:LysM peptidoglycan-binding domain-containing protein n=1 Tax=Pseudarthrobacter sulfonivorans TaxID=121292 RepID=UPI002859F286|nr:LysM peptidoglycan-binding domain-containing protein [Pseudarthrobacter sulfonivorans]MDR6413820.1 hypothetical protein [Pseudarthrobacter sulfonivorans]
MTGLTPRGLRADAIMAASILLLGSFLYFAGVGLLDRWELSAARRQAPGVDDLLGAFAVAAGLAIVVWWILSVLMAVAVAVLARCGRLRAADRAAGCCPGFMRRLAVAALSAQLLAAPMAHAAVPPAGPAWVPTQDVAVQAQWSPTESHQVAQMPGRASQAEGPPNSDTPATDASPPVVRPDWRPSAPVTDPGLLAAPSIRALQDTPPLAHVVTVLAGDTLWDIAARQLGPTASDVEVALHWPRWYEANKAQIGENPHVLLPGQILKTPSTA